MLDPPHLPPTPRPHCSIFVKSKRGVGPDQSKRGPEEDPKDPTTVNEDPKGPDHCK